MIEASVSEATMTELSIVWLSNIVSRTVNSCSDFSRPRASCAAIAH